jgi:hypothetical protein
MNSFTDANSQRRQGESSPLIPSDEQYDDKLISLITDDDDDSAEIFEASLSFDNIGVAKNGWTGSCKSFNGFHCSDQSVEAQPYQQLRLSIRQQKLQADDYAKLFAEVDEDSTSNDDDFPDNVVASPVCPERQAVENKVAYELKRSLITKPTEQSNGLLKKVTIVPEKYTTTNTTTSTATAAAAATTTTTKATAVYRRPTLNGKQPTTTPGQTLHPPVRKKTPSADELHHTLSELPTLHRSNLIFKEKNHSITSSTTTTATSSTSSSVGVLSFTDCDPFESVSSLSIGTMDSMIDICCPSPGAGTDDDSVTPVSPMKSHQPKRIPCRLTTAVKGGMYKKNNRTLEDAAPRAPLRKKSFHEDFTLDI